MTIAQHVVDFNLRKSWRTVKRVIKSDVVIFSGDMLDNGRGAEGDKERVTVLSDPTDRNFSEKDMINFIISSGQYLNTILPNYLSTIYQETMM